MKAQINVSITEIFTIVDVNIPLTNTLQKFANINTHILRLKKHNLSTAEIISYTVLTKSTG